MGVLRGRSRRGHHSNRVQSDFPEPGKSPIVCVKKNRNADRQETQVSAIVAYLNREEGLPVATNKNLNAETSYEELVRQSLKPKPANAD